jgi:two-component system response regulator AtoC
MQNTVLVIDDEETITEFIGDSLLGEGYLVEVANNGKDGIDLAKKLSPDIIILDFMLPDMDGISVLKNLKAFDENVQVIMLTGYNSAKTAIEAIRLGAVDYITKPFDMEELKLTLAKSVEQSKLRNQVKYLKENTSRKFTGSGIVLCVSEPMQAVYKLATQVAATNDTTVLIYGESGVGKEHVAQFIHLNSARQAKEFVELNCAAIPDNLLESELFGYEPGAFTDARSKKLGLFEFADNGTIFLDEIGDMPLQTQAKVLKVLETKSFRRVGGLRDIKSDVRIVTATNKNLADEVRKGTFRQDLYYRLNVVALPVPPLRERHADIRQMAAYFVEIYAKNFRKKTDLSPDAMRVLLAAPWNGNVRELKNVIERAMIVVPNGTSIQPEHLNMYISSAAAPPPVTSVAEPQSKNAFIIDTNLDDPSKNFSLKGVVEQVERAFIERALSQSNGNQQRAAKILGIERHVLRYHLKKYGIQENP